MVSDLPTGWAWATVRELAGPHPGALTDGPFGSNLKTEHYVSEPGPRVIRLQNIGDGVFRGDDQAFISREHFESLKRHDARPGDVLIAALGDVLPRACLVPDAIGPAIVKADCFRFRPARGINAHLIQHLLNSPQARDAAAHLISGVGRPRLNLGKVGDIRLPVAPAEEQERIVSAVEEQFSRVDAGVAALNRVRHNLKRMRAAVLHAAVTGRLTDPHLGDADHELPLHWCRVSVGDIAEVSGGITKNPKRRPNNNPVPFLRVANVPRDGLALDDVHEIEVFDGELERMKLRAGDLLVVEGNGSPDQIGRSALWHGEIDPCVHQNHLIRVRPSDRVLPEYLNLYWNAPSSMATIQAAASSTSGLHTLSTGKVRAIPVALPPVDAQARIVDEVKRQLSFIDALEGELHATTRRSHSLRSSILADAFSGNLVRHDPTEEPAAVLLERISAELSESNGKRPTGRRSRTKVTA